jgi:DNA-directed RNA polymerase specialized sigma24 family protein
MKLVEDPIRELYRKVTGDTRTDARTIKAHLALLSPRKRMCVQNRAAGMKLAEIAEIDGGCHMSTMSTYIRRALFDIQKAIAAGLPPGTVT